MTNTWEKGGFSPTGGGSQTKMKLLSPEAQILLLFSSFFLLPSGRSYNFMNRDDVTLCYAPCVFASPSGRSC